MTGHANWVSELKETKIVVRMGTGALMPSVGIENVSLTMYNLSKVKTDVTFNDMLVVFRLTVNLISLPRVTVQGDIIVIIEKRNLFIKDKSLGGKLVIVAKHTTKQSLFVLDCTMNLPKVIEDKCFVV